MTESTCAIGGSAVVKERCFCVDILVWSIFTGAEDVVLSGSVDLTLSGTAFSGPPARHLRNSNIEVTFDTGRVLQEDNEIVSDFEQTVTADQWPPKPTNSAAGGSLASGQLFFLAVTIVTVFI